MIEWVALIAGVVVVTALFVLGAKRYLYLLFPPPDPKNETSGGVLPNGADEDEDYQESR